LCHGARLRQPDRGSLCRGRLSNSRQPKPRWLMRAPVPLPAMSHVLLRGDSHARASRMILVAMSPLPFWVFSFHWRLAQHRGLSGGRRLTRDNPPIANETKPFGSSHTSPSKPCQRPPSVGSTHGPGLRSVIPAACTSYVVRAVLRWLFIRILKSPQWRFAFVSSFRNRSVSVVGCSLRFLK